MPTTVLRRGCRTDARSTRSSARTRSPCSAPEVRAAFGDRLPFLMKVLAVNEALSLQVHPSREQARAGFARTRTGR